MKRLARTLPFAFLLAGVLLLFRHALFSRWRGVPWDLRGYHLPLATYFATALRAGEFPLWDPYTYCGFPFYANLQAQAFYPPAWIVALAANLLGGRMVDYLEWEMAAHVLLGGVFAYLLLRHLGCGTAAAALGGAAFELGGFFASQAQHLGAISSAAWMPAVWLGVFSLRDGVSARRVAWVAAALAMAFLAGFPQVFLVVVFSSGMLALALVALRQARLTLLAGLALAGLGSALLAAPQLFPAWQLTGLSTARMRGQWFDSPGGVPWQGLVSMVAPGWYHIFELDRYKLPWNPTFLYLYVSVPGLLLALAALALRKKREWAPVALAGLACGLWMMGEHTPVWRAVHRLVPVSVRSALYAEFAMAGFLLAVALLAGWGAEWLVAGRSRRIAWVLAVLVAADLIHAGAGRPMNTTQTREQDPIATPTEFEGSRETLARMRELAGRFTPPARIDTAGDTSTWATAANAMRLYSANGDQPHALMRLLEVRQIFSRHPAWVRYAEVTDPASPILGLLNVRYLVTWEGHAPAAVAAAGLPHVAHLPGHEVYENPRTLPRFFLVYRARRAAGLEAAMAYLRAPDFDPAREAVVEGAAPDLPARDLPVPPPVRVIGYGTHSLRLEAETAAPALLVTSEAHYPGWHAAVDGREQPILMVNGAFRGLALGRGRHEIRMWFSPAILWWSLAAGAAGWAAWGWAVYRKRYKRAPAVSPNGSSPHSAA